MNTDLWPEFDIASKPTPRSIVEQAGAGLEKKTKGKLKFRLGATSIAEGFVSFDCQLHSPGLSYLYPFLKVRFPLGDEYPVELVADKFSDTIRATNENELVDMLGKIFQSPTTIKTIQMLLALSN